MAPQWTESSDKHGIPRPDQVYAIVNATYAGPLPGESNDDGQVWLYIGPPHAQALPENEIEILVNVYADERPARNLPRDGAGSQVPPIPTGESP